MGNLIRSFDYPPPSRSRRQFLQRVMAIGGLLLIGSTWRIWFPVSDFPRVPLLGLARGFPLICDWIGSLLLVAMLVGWAIVPAESANQRRLAFGISLCFVASMILNQQCIQPWAYLTCLACLLFGSCPPARTFACLRWLIISVYFYSAISKFDYQFLHRMGSAIRRYRIGDHSHQPGFRFRQRSPGAGRWYPGLRIPNRDWSFLPSNTTLGRTAGLGHASRAAAAARSLGIESSTGGSLVEPAVHRLRFYLVRPNSRQTLRRNRSVGHAGGISIQLSPGLVDPVGDRPGIGVADV